MLKIKHLRDACRLKYQNKTAVEYWELPEDRFFWANKFNIFQVQQGLSTLPFNFEVIAVNKNGLDVLIVRLSNNVIVNHALILAGKALALLLKIL